MAEPATGIPKTDLAKVCRLAAHRQRTMKAIQVLGDASWDAIAAEIERLREENAAMRERIAAMGGTD